MANPKKLTDIVSEGDYIIEQLFPDQHETIKQSIINGETSSYDLGTMLAEHLHHKAINQILRNLRFRTQDEVIQNYEDPFTGDLVTAKSVHVFYQGLVYRLRCYGYLDENNQVVAIPQAFSIRYVGRRGIHIVVYNFDLDSSEQTAEQVLGGEFRAVASGGLEDGYIQVYLPDYVKSVFLDLVNETRALV